MALDRRHPDEAPARSHAVRLELDRRHGAVREGDAEEERDRPGVWAGAGHVSPLPAGVARRLSDVVSARALPWSAFYAEICRPLGTRHVLELFLDACDGVAGLVLESGSSDFTRRDRDVLEALAPHLALVRLAADGLTNREIAAALFIAPGTVRKHLDNVYGKLGVRSRAAAVAAVLAAAE